MSETATLTKKDFASDVAVKWCPGCGDYGILSAIQSTMPHIGVPKEKIVFISGIGCSSRFPHYMSTYGFHTIHGRAPAVATGLTLANPDLSVWLITGDGDGLSIGGNHLLHVLRRNVNINILLFNNNIYGLTKGQASPTSHLGTVTKSTPLGSITEGLTPLNFAITAGATFVARTMANNPKHMQEVFKAASQHNGVSFIEILQNCVIFNDGVHENTTSPKTKNDYQLHLEHGQPMKFGAELEKGLKLNPQTFEIEVVNVADVNESELLVHDINSDNKGLQLLLAQLAKPTVFGVLKTVQKEKSYAEIANDQIKSVQAAKGKGSVQDLIDKGDTWIVE